jgi:hyperosmotically inducible periplasmic protein
MRFAAISVLAVIGLTGCEPIDTSPPVPSTAAPATNDVPPAKDNTAVNERDSAGSTKTPIDQDENQADVNRTAEIRKRIVALEGVSINAQNVKVVTSKGKVTLRGPVENQAEKDMIDRIAREVAGDTNVQNLLELAKP